MCVKIRTLFGQPETVGENYDPLAAQRRGVTNGVREGHDIVRGAVFGDHMNPTYSSWQPTVEKKSSQNPFEHVFTHSLTNGSIHCDQRIRDAPEDSYNRTLSSFQSSIHE